jgi:ribose transport system substrate-binding protein
MTRPVHGVVDRARRLAVWAAASSALLGVTFAVTACGSSDNSTTSATNASTAAATTTATTTDTADGTAAAAAAVDAHRKPIDSFDPPGPAVDAATLKGKEIWFIPVASVIPTIPPQEEGVKQGAEALGMSVHTCDGNFIPATEAACIKQAVNAGAAGIVTSAIDPLTVQTAVAEAGAKDVPIVTMADVGSDTDSLQFLPPSDVANAPLAADWIVADSGGKASVLATTITGDKGTTAAADAFVTELQKQCPDCKLTNITQSPANSAKFTSAVSTALLQHPDTDYVFAQYDTVVAPVARGIQQSGHKVKLVSTTASPGNVKDVADGGQAVEVGVNPNYYGWLAVDRLTRMLLDQPAPESDWLPLRVFDATNVGTLELTPQAASSGEWWGSLAYRDDFRTLWGVG